MKLYVLIGKTIYRFHKLYDMMMIILIIKMIII